jgi:hypothetical protein
MNQEQRNELEFVRDRIVGFDAECSEKEYTDTGDAWDLLNAAKGAIEGALKQKEPNGPFMGCLECGCTDIEHECWVETNTNRPTDDCGSKNIWCPQCQTSEGRCIEVDKLKPYDAEAEHGIPEGE